MLFEVTYLAVIKYVLAGIKRRQYTTTAVVLKNTHCDDKFRRIRALLLKRAEYCAEMPMLDHPGWQ